MTSAVLSCSSVSNSNGSKVSNVCLSPFLVYADLLLNVYIDYFVFMQICYGLC